MLSNLPDTSTATLEIPQDHKQLWNMHRYGRLVDVHVWASVSLWNQINICGENNPCHHRDRPYECVSMGRERERDLWSYFYLVQREQSSLYSYPFYPIVHDYMSRFGHAQVLNTAAISAYVW